MIFRDYIQQLSSPRVFFARTRAKIDAPTLHTFLITHQKRAAVIYNNKNNPRGAIRSRCATLSFSRKPIFNPEIFLYLSSNATLSLSLHSRETGAPGQRLFAHTVTFAHVHIYALARVHIKKLVYIDRPREPILYPQM